MIDQSEIGKVVGNMMDEVERMVETGEIPVDAVVRRCLVVVEVAHDGGDRGSRFSLVTTGVTNDEHVLALGLIERARHTVLFPDPD